MRKFIPFAIALAVASDGFRSRAPKTDPIFNTGCCTVTVVDDSNKLHERAGPNIPSDTGITFLKPSGKPGISFVVSPHSREMDKFMENPICDALLLPELEKELKGDFQPSDVLDKIKRRAILKLKDHDVISNYSQLLNTGRKELAERYIKGSTEQCAVYLASKARSSNLRRDSFINVVLHEAGHGAIVSKGLTPTVLGHEVVAHLTEIIYSPDPKLALRHFFGFAVPLDTLTVEQMGGIQVSEDEVMRSRYQAKVLNELKILTGTDSVLGILKLPEDALRNAAHDVLKKITRRNFNMDEIINPDEMNSLVNQAIEYCREQDSNLRRY